MAGVKALIKIGNCRMIDIVTGIYKYDSNTYIIATKSNKVYYIPADLIISFNEVFDNHFINESNMVVECSIEHDDYDDKEYYFAVDFK